MADWKTTLDVSDIFYRIDKSVKEKAVVIADRLLLLSTDPAFSEEEDDELTEFSQAFRDTVDTTESFDSLWEEFYDFADYDKRIWIKLF